VAAVVAEVAAEVAETAVAETAAEVQVVLALVVTGQVVQALVVTEPEAGLVTEPPAARVMARHRRRQMLLLRHRQRTQQRLPQAWLVILEKLPHQRRTQRRQQQEPPGLRHPLTLAPVCRLARLLAGVGWVALVRAQVVLVGMPKGLADLILVIAALLVLASVVPDKVLARGLGQMMQLI